PSYINPAIPAEIEQVILRALEKDPRYRYQTAIELAQAYTEALEASTYADELPPFYEMSDMDEAVLPVYSEAAALPVETPPYVPVEEAQVVLPSDPVEAPSAIPSTMRRSAGGRRTFRRSGRNELGAYPTPRIRRRRGPSNQGPLADPVSTPEPPLSTPPYPIRRRKLVRRPQRRSPRHSFRITVLMGLILLLIIILLIVFAIISHGAGSQPNTGLGTAPLIVITTTPAVVSTSTGAATQPTATANIQATQQTGNATATAVTSTTPLLTDNLSSAANSNWPNDGTNCVFRQGTYHVVVTSADFLQPCELNGQAFDNVALQVNVSLLSGSDAGLIFRANGDQFYDFEINNKGEFFLRRHDAGAGSKYNYLIQNTQSAAIAPIGQKNTLLVIANGSNFKLFINGTFVGEAQDSTYASGQMGCVAGTLSPDKRGEASFADLSVFKASA
ncbi:MAG TPA: family 16 glycoside hydrolase, partial [Ktedonobacteraceae bacterium]|nr:family 16 glycoside hydrolase [Ktedonobacteraceae bacterium]